MSRIKFMASGMSYEFRGKKELELWKSRILNYGLNHEIQYEGNDVFIIVDDRGDPFFEPKQKPSVGETESRCKD